MGADAVHHLYLGNTSCSLKIERIINSARKAEYKKAYPEAKVIGVEPLVAKKTAQGFTLDGGLLRQFLLHVDVDPRSRFSSVRRRPPGNNLWFRRRSM